MGTGIGIEVETYGDQRRKDNYKEESGAYVHLRNHDTDYSMDTLLTKIVKGIDNQESCLKEIMAKTLRLSQNVELHATAIKRLENQFFQMSTTLNQRQPSTLQSNTIKYTKNSSHYFTVTTQSGKAMIDPPMFVDNQVRNDNIDLYVTPKAKTEKLVTNGETSQKSMGAKK